MTDHRDVVEAFLDKEPVEAAALERALADGEAREYFIDLIVLRGLVGNAPIVAQPHQADRRGHSVWWLAAAAALVAVGTTGGYLAGRVTDRPSVPSRVEQVGTTPAAPAPTHVIRLENGVTWNEKSGGN
jgi:hypothetical protein